MVLKDNSQDVVSDLIEGEMVLLHLRAGNYFSLTGTAASLWAALQQGLDPAQSLMVLSQAYPELSKERLDQDLQVFLTRLRQEDLIVESSAPSLGVACFEGSYEAPELNKYTDLQDLLLIDPIHESDATGWPALPAQA